MIRLALIGCRGDAARYSHVAPRLRGGRFTAFVDREPLTAGGVATHLGAVLSSDSFDALLSDRVAAFDAVVVHGQGRAHASLCQRAAVAGKHVLVDGLP